MHGRDTPDAHSQGSKVPAQVLLFEARNCSCARIGQWRGQVDATFIRVN